MTTQMQERIGPPTEEALAQISRELVVQGKIRTLQRMAALARDVVPSAEHAGISLRLGDGPSAAFTSPRVERAHQLQDELEEGPGREAAREVFCVTQDTGADDRWPRWGPLVAGLGLRSLLGVQLVDDAGAEIGTMSLYAESAGSFTAGDVDDARAFARQAAGSLVALREVDGLRTALHDSHVIGLAQGMLMELRGLSMDDAYDVLLRSSQEGGMSVSKVAASMVRTGKVPGAVPASAGGLSAREAELICLITEGLSNEEIAARLYLSINTVKTYIRSGYRKIGVTTRAQAVRWGVEHGMLVSRGRC